jgi:Fe-S cluster biogenesis protein NfuA
MTFTAEVESVLGELRPLVQGDGADLELRNIDETSRQVTLGLVLEGVECLDCVMPRDFLEQLAQQAMQDQVRGVRVVLEDPRDA